MTKVITRYFDSAAQARLAKRELVSQNRLSVRITSLLDQPDGLVDALTAGGVADATAKAYQKRMATDGGAVVMVRAGHKPLGVAKITRTVLDDMGAADLPELTQEVEIKDPVTSGRSVLEDHPLMLTRPRDPDSTDYRMADWPIPLISRRKPFRETVIPPHGRMASWPIGLLSGRKPYTGSIFSRHARMANFPIGLISKRKPFTGSIFSRHARMANFPIRLISKRKPYTGSVIPRHGRMATWPFPLLMNGKQGANALMPGAPRMANFPIRLISQRKPFTGSIFSRHARMASFPIGLISQRKPYTGSIVPKHGRMADFILPLIIKRNEPDPAAARAGFSLSKMMGMPTLIRR